NSMRIIPTSSVDNNSAATVAGSNIALSGLGVTFVPGRTYTVKATFRQVAPQTGTLNTNSRMIRTVTDGTGGGTVVTQALNVAGVQTLTHTFLVPSNATI